MNYKLKISLLKTLFLLIAISSLLLGIVFFLGTTIHINFETTVINNTFTPKIHITSIVPKIKDKYFSFPDLNKVTVLKRDKSGKRYGLKFEFKHTNNAEENKVSKSIRPVPIDRKTYEDAEKLQNEINDALQNNKIVKYELFSGSISFSDLYIIYFFICIVFIILFFLIRIKQIEK